MSSALAGIRSKVGAGSLTKSCTRDGCRVYMEGVPDCRVIVDMDKLPAAQRAKGKRCDFVLFLSADDGGVLAAPIEIKSGEVDASHAIEQLRSGAEFTARVSPRDVAVTCRPILFHGKSIHRYELRTLKRTKVDFRGVKLTAEMARCGQPRNLADALGSG